MIFKLRLEGRKAVRYAKSWERGCQEGKRHSKIPEAGKRSASSWNSGLEFREKRKQIQLRLHRETGWTFLAEPGKSEFCLKDREIAQ